MPGLWLYLQWCNIMKHLKYIRYSLLRFVTLGIYIFIMDSCIPISALLVLIIGAMGLFLVYLLNDLMPESLDFMRQALIWIGIFLPAYAAVSLSQGLGLSIVLLTCMKIVVICVPIASLISYLLKRIFGA